MKICILLSSYDGTNSSFEQVAEHQNPGIYVKSHQFEQRFITKENAEEKIDQIIQEGFDYIWNFLWGPNDENIAGVSAVKYLESKKVPIIGTSSKFLSMTKLDYKNALASAKINTPKGIAIKGDEESIINLDLRDLRFPLIVKPSVGCGSEYMTQESVCHDLAPLLKQIRILKSKINPNYRVLIEEFIHGEEVAVMILETKDTVIALEPLIYIFPKDWKSTQKFLDFDLKFRSEVSHKIFDEDLELVNNIKETGVKAYEALGVLGSGYARVDFRLKGTELYVLEVNPVPAFFANLGNNHGEDFIIESTFPGGHTNLVETIISSKMRFDSAIRHFNDMASTYDSKLLIAGTSNTLIWKNLIERYDFGGTVLDVGCGTGLLGNLIKEKYNTKVTGIDLSPGMIKLVQNYENIYIGLMENILFELNSTYNHVVSSGALFFVDNRFFAKIFSRMFDLATNSISLTVEDITEEYKSACAIDYTVSVFNHLDTIENFKIPTEWSLVYKERKYLWKSPNTALKIFGVAFRYEKISDMSSQMH